MNIVLMGTPEFVIPMLRTLHAHHTLLGVVTQPDRPKGRKRVPMPPPVKSEAVLLGIPVYQFERIRRPEPTRILHDFHADVIVTAAYGQILNQRHLDAARFGVINAHASLLPQYRGPAPVNRCLMAGETKTGITIMHTDIGIDDGDIILQKGLDIKPYETAGKLLDRLAPLAADAMIQALALIEAGKAPRIPQDANKASYHPMLKKEDGFLPFGLSAQRVCDHACGVTPWPGAQAVIGTEIFKFEGLRPTQGRGEPGEILAADAKNGFVVACGTNAVSIQRIQAPGKRMMDAAEFLRGRTNLCGLRFSL